MLRFIVLYLLISLINAVVVFLLVTTIREGFFKIKKASKPSSVSYIVKTPNRFEIQGFNQCAGYSSAYLMRHFGMDVNGEDIYKKMPKMKNGTILPKHVLSLLRKEGFNANYYRGSLNTLESVVEKGNPVIVFVRSYKGASLLHYVNVVGFDPENIYIVDSLEDYINSQDPFYNRKIPVNEFLELWNTSMFIMPLHKNTFFEIEN